MFKGAETEFDVREVVVGCGGVTVAMALHWFANPDLRRWSKRSTTYTSDIVKVDESSNEAFITVNRRD